MADEAAFTGFVTAGSKKAVRPSAAPFDPFADDAAPAPKPTGGALFQTAGAASGRHDTSRETVHGGHHKQPQHYVNVRCKKNEESRSVRANDALK